MSCRRASAIRRATAGAATALIAAFASTAWAGIVQRLPAPTSLRALHGNLLYAEPGPAPASKRLVLRSDHGRGRAKVVATVRGLTGFDLGTDTKGRLVVVYGTCGGATPGCRLVMTSPRLGTSAFIRNAHTPGSRDVDPAVWHGRLAWVRRTQSGPLVLTRLLSWPAKRASVRLPGVPERWRDAAGEPTYPTHGRSVIGLDIGPRGLAEIVRFLDPTEGLCGLSQVRLVATSPVHGFVVDQHICGLSGQSMSGPSQTGSAVSWLVWCAGDPGFCQQRGGAYRFDVATRRTRRIPISSGQFSGFASEGASAFMVQTFLGSDRCLPSAAPAGCPLIVRSGPWESARRTTPHERLTLRK